jgi:hypothetical protein
MTKAGLEALTAIDSAAKNLETAIFTALAQDVILDSDSIDTLERNATALTEQAARAVEQLRMKKGQQRKPGTLIRKIRKALGFTYP